MVVAKRLRRIETRREGGSIVLSLMTEDGTTTSVLASEDQIDRLVDELDDILNTPGEADQDGAG